MDPKKELRRLVDVVMDAISPPSFDISRFSSQSIKKSGDSQWVPPLTNLSRTRDNRINVVYVIAVSEKL